MLRLKLVLSVVFLFSAMCAANTFVVTTLTSSKTITVVEAEQNYDASGNGPSNPIALGLNTVPYDGVDRQIVFDGDTAWMSNQMWGGRSNWTADGLLTDGVWHSDHNNNHGNNAPIITTRVDVPLGSYEVYVVYCAADPFDLSTHHGGMAKSRLHDPGDMALLDTYGAEGNTLGLTEGEGTGVDVVSGWSIVVASLGTVSGTDTLAIDIARDSRRIGDATRNIYIGLGYRQLTCDNQAPLITMDENVFVEMNEKVLLNPIVTDDGKPYLQACDSADTENGTSVGLSYQWSVVDPAQAGLVAFSPDSQTTNPEVTFLQCGDFELQLQVWDDKNGQSPDTGAKGGKNTSETVIVHVNCPPDCLRLQEMGLKLTEDISGPFGVPDCYVDIYDLWLAASEWLGLAVSSDISGLDNLPDNQVNFYDLLLLSQRWLKCIDPMNTDCEDPYSLLRVASPDGNISVQFSIKSVEGVQNGLYWSVAYKGETVLADSQLGFSLQDAVALDAGFKIVDYKRTSHDSTWSTVYGERSQVRDNYTQIVVSLEDDQVPARRLDLTFRAYDEGAAFRYSFPEQEAFSQITISSENTHFSFLGDHTIWAVYGSQGVYSKRVLSAIGSNCERPLTMKDSNGLYMSIVEAGLVDYSRMNLKLYGAIPNTVVSQLGGSATITMPYSTPWRGLMIAEKPGDLLENNFFTLNLNEPCAIEDTSWIRPGKVMRDLKITKANSKAIVDFAAVAGIDYVHIDAGWYGNEGTPYPAVDATTITPTRSEDPNFDLDELLEIIDYAHANGVKVMVYVNHRHLESQMDDIFPLYKSWGIDGIKYGFVNVGNQYWTTWLHDAVRKAAEFQFVVDVHDNYRVTGYERTYPNLMTVEGIRGNETGPSAVMNTIAPFTRFVCGPADATMCWQNSVAGKMKNSWAHQMGTMVVYYSPLQFLFWYDSPGQYSGDEPYLEFFKNLKTVWNETRVIHGEIGEYITVARRDGQDWFVGTLNAVQQRQLEIPLDFLTPGEQYTAYIYKDTDPATTDIWQVAYDQISVTSDSVVNVDMASNGGHAMRIVFKVD